MLTIVQPVYTFTVTADRDEDFRKYIARKVGENTPRAASDTLAAVYQAGTTPLDISMDDIEGDVVAGIAAQTQGDCLHIDMLWVHPSLRGRGIGKKLMQMAEDAAAERGCTRVRITTTTAVSYYQKLGCTVVGKLQQFPDGCTITWLAKDLASASLSEVIEKDPA